jgi:hypothetical protein
MKICKDCKSNKAISEYYGRSARCIPCHNIRTKLYYIANKTELIKKQALYNSTRKDKINSYKKLHWEKNKVKYSNRKKQNYLKNRTILLAKTKANYIKNKAAYLAKQKEWRLSHLKQDALTKKNYAKKHPEVYQAINSRRRAAKLNRTPKWLTLSDFIEMKWAYTEANRLIKETGIKHQVDHIIPLQGKNISGLHCPQNLQIITKTENAIKGNKFPYSKGK